MRKVTFAAASAIIAAASLAHAQSSPKVYSPQFDNEAQQQSDDVPQVQVWLDGKSLRYGEMIRPYAVTEPGAYLTVVRVTTDGDLRVLYPRQPQNQTRYRDGQFANDRLPIADGNAAFVREGTGNGFVFAIASYYRFNFSYYSTNGYWSTARLANAARYGSPFEIVRRFVEEIMEESDSYSMDYVMYDVSSDGYRSRYASRYRGYAYSDYLDLCYSSFSVYNVYCRGYGYGFGYRYPIVANNPPQQQPGGGHTKLMRIKPLVPDPVLPHGPREMPAPQGRFPSNNPAEDAAIARHERMLRDARPRTEPQQPMMRAEPRSEPRMAPREQPRMEPRNEQPRIEMRKYEPPPQPRVEMRAAPPSPPPPPREHPKKDNDRN
jgi:hypothetical protein